MACQGGPLLRAVAADLPVLTRSCSITVQNTSEYTMERTNSTDLMLADFLARTNSGTVQHEIGAPEANATAVPTFKRKRSLTINTSVENVFQLLASPGEKSPSTKTLKASPTTLRTALSRSFAGNKSSPTLPTLSRTASKDSLFGSILADVLVPAADVPQDPTQNGMCESSLIEPPPVESRMATTDCMHQVDEQQIAQALARARLVHERELQAQQQPAALVSSLCCEPNKGPYGPYNPCPSYMLGVQRLERLSAPYQIPAPPPPPDEYAGKTVTMVRGKYTGKKAFVQHRVNKKYRVQVEGVAWGLEFYPDMFKLDY